MKARVFVANGFKEASQRLCLLISVGTTFLVAGAFGVAAFMLGHWLQRFLNEETDA